MVEVGGVYLPVVDVAWGLVDLVEDQGCEGVFLEGLEGERGEGDVFGSPRACGRL